MLFFPLTLALSGRNNSLDKMKDEGCVGLYALVCIVLCCAVICDVVWTPQSSFFLLAVTGVTVSSVFLPPLIF